MRLLYKLKMKRLAAILLFLSCCLSAGAQTKAAIDSINNIPFEKRIQKAVALTPVFLKNARAAEKIRYSLGIADSYSNLALVYYYQGKYSDNVSYSLKAIKIYEQLNATDRQAYEYAGLGYSMKRRDMDMAQYYMQKGKQIAERFNHTKPLLSIYNNYGVLKEMQNDLDSALYFYKKGLVLKESVNDSLGIPFSLNCIGGVYIMQKKYDEAAKLFQRALSIRTSRNDTIGIAENYTWLGDLHYAQQKHQTAISWYQKSLELALQNNYLFLAQSNYKSLSDSYDALNDKALALENFRNYAKIRDSLTNKETNSKIAELEVQFDTNRKEKMLAEANNLVLIKDAEANRQRTILATTFIVLFFALLIGYLLYRQQKLKNLQLQQEHFLKTAILQIEAQNKLQDQRLGIARDLHDNIGSQLTFIISSVENIKYAFDITNQKLDQKLQSISSFARETIVELRDTIWAMNSTEISVEDLATRILNLIEKAREANDSIAYSFHFDDELAKVRFTSIEGMNIYRTIQEAINNALKYASASEISINITDDGNSLLIQVADDGNGFDTDNAEMGNGIRNMERRTSDIGGNFKITSSNQGTAITIKLPKPNAND